MAKEKMEDGSSSRELKVIGAGLSRTGTLSTRYHNRLKSIAVSLFGNMIGVHENTRWHNPNNHSVFDTRCLA